jgi:hypothetical protein
VSKRWSRGVCLALLWAGLLVSVIGCATVPGTSVHPEWSASAGAVYLRDVPFYSPSADHPYTAILDMISDYWDPAGAGISHWRRGDSAWRRDWRQPDLVLERELAQRGVWADWGSGDMDGLFQRLTRDIPVWFFLQASSGPMRPALVVGWDRDRERLLLYGVEAYPLEVDATRFADEWERAGWYWVVALPPDWPDWSLSPEQYHSRGRYWMGKANYERAAADFAAALAAVPDEARYYVELGDSHLQRQQFAAAEPLYRAALLLDDRNARVMNNLAHLLMESGGDLSEALFWARRATTLEPHNPLMLDTLGVGLHRDGQYAEAVRVLQRARTRALQMDAAIQAEIALHLVAVYEDMDQPHLARQTLADAMAHDPSLSVPRPLRKHLRPHMIVPRR